MFKRSLLRFLILTIFLVFITVHAEELQCGVNNNPNKEPTVRIVGGRVAEDGEFPHQVRLSIKPRPGPWCGATILDESHILTAAHCVNSSKLGALKPDDVLAHVGSRYNDSGEEVTIGKIAVHKLFDYDLFHCDLALLQTSKPMSFKLPPEGDGSVNKVCMPTAPVEYKFDDSFIGTGWGDTNRRRKYSTILKQVAMYKTDERKCSGRFGTVYDPPNELCTLGRLEESPCYGDSGGPLVRLVGDGNLYELVGVVSRSDKCGEDGVPSIYIKVDKFLDWIEEAKTKLIEQEDNTSVQI